MSSDAPVPQSTKPQAIPVKSKAEIIARLRAKAQQTSQPQIFKPSANPKLTETPKEQDKSNDLFFARMDAINRLIAEVESGIKKLKPLSSVWVVLDDQSSGYEIQTSFGPGRIPGGYGRSNSESGRIGYIKHDGRWCLCYQANSIEDELPGDDDPAPRSEGDIEDYDRDYDDENYESRPENELNIMPLLECPALIRLRAASVLGELRDRIIAAKSMLVNDAEDAIKKLTALRDELGG